MSSVITYTSLKTINLYILTHVKYKPIIVELILGEPRITRRFPRETSRCSVASHRTI